MANSQNKLNPSATIKGLTKHLFFIPTRHGNLSALFCEPATPAPKGKKRLTVITSHGFGPDNSMVEAGRLFLRLAEGLAKKNICTLLFAYPGTAESDGFFSDMSAKQRIEALQDVIDWFIGSKIGPYAVAGFSMGAGVAIHALDRTQTKPPQFFVTINAVPSFDESAKSFHQWHSQGPEPERVLGLGKKFFTAKPKKTTAAAYAGISCPKLHVQAGNDIPHFAKEFRAIFQSDTSPGAKVWVDVPGSDHCFENVEHQSKLLSALTAWIHQQNKTA